MTVKTAPGIALFDLDRTVTRAATFTPFLFHCAAALGRPRAAMVAAVLPALARYGLGLSSRGAFKARMLACSIAGRTREEVEGWAAGFAGAWLTTHVRPGARSAIARHKAAGDRLVLATASFDFHARPFATVLGFDDLVATVSVWEDGLLMPALAGENCYGPAKIKAVRARFGEESPVAAYSDHHTDLELLRWAADGVAINPSRRLRAAARASALRIEDWG